MQQIDQNNGETWLTLTQIASLLPRIEGRKVHVITVKRWMRKGCYGIVLASRRFGRRWMCTPQALAQFQADCTAQGTGKTVQPLPVDRKADVENARARLREIGFYRPRKTRVRNVREEQKTTGQGQDPTVVSDEVPAVRRASRSSGPVPVGLHGAEPRG